MPNTFKEEETSIDGLRLLLNKVVGDERGVFADLAETDNPVFEQPIRHIHASIATTKGVGRGGHYHHHLTETFYVLSGIGLCLFHDFREDSPTKGATYAVILGYEKPEDVTPLPIYTISGGSLAQVITPPGVYHAFWPLSDEKLVIAATGTHGYDEDDYVRPLISEIPGAEDLLRQHNITP